MVRIEETPISRNTYDEVRDVIVIDEKLREYPEALKMVVFHELKHAYIEEEYDTPFRKFIEHAKHELVSDIDYAFSHEEEHRQFRKYIREEKGETGRASLLSFVRTFWAVPLYIIKDFKTSREA